MGYSFRLAARVILYASSHREDNTYHGLCYTSRGSLAGTRNSLIGSPQRIDPTTHRTMSERSYHGATSRSPPYEVPGPIGNSFSWPMFQVNLRGTGTGNDIYVSISIYGSDTPVTRPETDLHQGMYLYVGLLV